MPGFLSNIDMNGNLIRELADPLIAQDAATKAYVDALVEGLSWKDSVRVATVVAGTLATSFENGDTVDGVALVTGDRILIKDQAAPTENGIYTVNASGAPTRAIDANTGAELVGAAVHVTEGSTTNNTNWTQTSAAPITLGVTNITWVQFGASGGTVNKFIDTTVGDGVSVDITITHLLGTLGVIVALYDNADEALVYCDVERVDTNNIALHFAVAPASNAYTCVVHG